RFRRCFGAAAVPWRRRQSVAGQSIVGQSIVGQSIASEGNPGSVARAALAVPTKKDAEILADPRPRFQGGGGARSLEAGRHRTFPAPQNLSHLSLVGRSWAEVARGRPSGSGGVLCNYARVDESEFQLLSRHQHRLSQ